MPPKLGSGVSVASPLLSEAMSELAGRGTDERFVIGLRFILER